MQTLMSQAARPTCRYAAPIWGPRHAMVPRVYAWGRTWRLAGESAHERKSLERLKQGS